MMKREVSCSISGMPVAVQGVLWSTLAGMVLALEGGIVSPGYAQSAASSPSSSASLCPQPALSRLTRHTIAQGETIESIAQTYNLLPATLLGFNATLRNGTAPVGTEIVIPPYNGVRVEAPAGSTWRQLATTYNVRADALFEANGCQNQV
ncbi:MAG TPA: LysM domain-containing protein, partial [Allocoleopsis sp.]